MGILFRVMSIRLLSCVKVEEAEGSWYYTFKYGFDKKKAKQGYMTVEKGSVTVNGVSLTVVNSKKKSLPGSHHSLHI